MKQKSCEIMQYFDYYDTNDIEVIYQRALKLPNIKKVAVVIHDKDKLPDGTPKKHHFHLVATMSNSTTFSNIAKIMHVDEQYVQKIKANTPKYAFLYLCHKNAPDKYQYDPSIIKSNFDYLSYIDDVDVSCNIKDIISRIDNGEIRRFNITDYLSIDDYIKYNYVIDRAFTYRAKKLQRIKERDMDCVFISGDSGTGKSTFAKDFCKKKNLSYYVSDLGKNPLDNYEGQDVIILDDLRDSTYKLNDFLKLTDNNTDSRAEARYYNKSILECKMLIVTSIQKIKDFYKKACEENTETQVQIFRRFQTYIYLTRDEIIFSVYNQSKNDYTYCTSMKNYISILYNARKRYDFVNDIVSIFTNDKPDDLMHEVLAISDDIADEYLNGDKPITNEVLHNGKTNSNIKS